MGIESLLNRTCAVSRKSEGAVNDHNEPTESWATLSGQGEVPYRRIPLTGDEETEGKQYAEATHMVITEAGWDITEKDWLVDGADGVVLMIQFVNKEPGGVPDHHFEIAAKEIRV